MLVIIKSAPDTPDGKRGLKLAKDMAADVCLIQSAIYFAQKDRLEGFCGTAYVLAEDCRLRGLSEGDIEKDIKEVTYDDLVDLMVREEGVAGMF